MATPNFSLPKFNNINILFLALINKIFVSVNWANLRFHHIVSKVCISYISIQTRVIILKNFTKNDLLLHAIFLLPLSFEPMAV